MHMAERSRVEIQLSEDTRRQLEAHAAALNLSVPMTAGALLALMLRPPADRGHSEEQRA
jgi:hypothetical protein